MEPTRVDFGRSPFKLGDELTVDGVACRVIELDARTGKATLLGQDGKLRVALPKAEESQVVEGESNRIDVDIGEHNRVRPSEACPYCASRDVDRANWDEMRLTPEQAKLIEQATLDGAWLLQCRACGKRWAALKARTMTSKRGATSVSKGAALPGPQPATNRKLRRRAAKQARDEETAQRLKARRHGRRL